MSKQSESVKRWREHTKSRMINAMGGKCCICGYNRCQSALEFHHLDPTEKEFGFGTLVASPQAWVKIASELEKCVLVCANCHREVHADMTTIPENAVRFNKDSAYHTKATNQSPCLVCGKPKPSMYFTCSKVCAAKRPKVKWNKYDLEKMIETYSIMEIADIIGVSHGTVWRRIQKIRKMAGVVGLEPTSRALTAPPLTS